MEPKGKCHTYHVLHNVLKLLEHSNEPEVLVLAALFHDIGNGKCKAKKVVESESSDVLDGYAQRIEHQYWSMLDTIEILGKIGFTSDTIIKVVKLVGVHDLRKCKIGHTIKDKEEQLLNEADAAWMFSEDGITRDIERAIENGVEPMSREDQLKWNKKVNCGLFKYRR